MIKENKLTLCRCDEVAEPRQHLCHAELYKTNRRGTSLVSLYASAKPLAVSASFDKDCRRSNPANKGLLKVWIATLTTFARNDRKRAAFTLAEVLITLGIIGVVAAMTIPTLVKNYEKKITVTRLEKTYSTLSQAIKMAQAEHGDVSTWDFSLSGKEFFDTYFASLKKDAEFKFNETLPQYKRLRGGYATDYNVVIYSDKVNVIELPSGAWILYYYDNTAQRDARVEFHIDINGPQKPNQFGKDFFYLHLMRNGELVFFQNKSKEPFSVRRNRNELMNTNHYYACNKQQDGIWCGALIQLDGWQIKDDYPW